MMRNTAAAWGSVAKSFHWLMAGLILGQFVLGWLAEGWRLSPIKLGLFFWHKSFGTAILVLALLRLSWRLLNRTPSMPPTMPVWEQHAAHASHAALYALMVVMPLSGWIINSAANIPFSVFWLVPLPDLVAPNKSLQQTAEAVHLDLFWLFALVLGLHISAALRHHILLNDEVLVRMLPVRHRRSGPPP
jgi:cytochrome b561